MTFLSAATSSHSHSLPADPAVAEETILIVDDDHIVLKALEETLKREGYRVVAVSNGTEAIAYMQKYPIALILCDQWLTDLKGIEVLFEAKRVQPKAIRIAMTAHQDISVLLEAVNVAQVSQFVTKPWDSVFLSRTIASSMEQFRLEKINGKLNELIQKQHLELESSHARLREESILGEKIYRELLQGKVPVEIAGASISVSTALSKEIDGDFFDFYRPVPHLMDIVLGDVSGKGIPAALVGTAVKMELLRFAVPFHHGVYCKKNGPWEEDLLSPSMILTHAHEGIFSKLHELEYFVSLFYARFDLQKKTLRFVDCGSTKPLHYKKETGALTLLAGTGCPLGMREDSCYIEGEVYWQAGDIFVFYSDGVTESHSEDRPSFGVEKLARVVKERSLESAQNILDRILHEATLHAQGLAFEDDLVLIVLKMEEGGGSSTSGPFAANFSSDLSQLKAVREFILRTAEKARGDRQRFAPLLQVAVNEAFCNIVEHGYRGGQSGPIMIECSYLEEGLLIDIADQGTSFEPHKVPDPSFFGDKDGGFGLYMIRQVADHVAYLPKMNGAGWNHLHIFKHYITEEAFMELAHQIEGNILVITPLGRSLDARDAREFKEKVMEIIFSTGCFFVVIDLQNLQFIDSSGLGSFLSILKNLHLREGDLKLSSMTQPVRTIFELVSMHKIIDIMNSTEEALAFFRSTPAKDP